MAGFANSAQPARGFLRRILDIPLGRLLKWALWLLFALFKGKNPAGTGAYGASTGELHPAACRALDSAAICCCVAALRHSERSIMSC